jgi:hypothetical protein
MRNAGKSVSAQKYGILFTSGQRKIPQPSKKKGKRKKYFSCSFSRKYARKKKWEENA